MTNDISRPELERILNASLQMVDLFADAKKILQIDDSEEAETMNAATAAIKEFAEIGEVVLGVTGGKEIKPDSFEGFSRGLWDPVWQVAALVKSIGEVNLSSQTSKNKALLELQHAESTLQSLVALMLKHTQQPRPQGEQ